MVIFDVTILVWEFLLDFIGEKNFVKNFLSNLIFYRLKRGKIDFFDRFSKEFELKGEIIIECYHVQLSCFRDSTISCLKLFKFIKIQAIFKSFSIPLLFFNSSDLHKNPQFDYYQDANRGEKFGNSR